MSSSDTFIIPEGWSPPLTVVTDKDHTAWILIATSLGLVCTLIFGGIRVFIRKSINPDFGLDDIFLASATVSVRKISSILHRN